MKREIKFRAWNTRTKVMQYTNKEQTVWAGGLQPSINVTIATSIGAQISGDFVAMQFTGLKDKNGKEIYEGDIVKYIIDLPAAEPTEYTEDVTFVDGCFAVEIVTPLYVVSDICEVIGNIYQHPHLLKA